MEQHQPDMTPQEAAGLLVWLVESGADEIMLEQPVDRFAEPPPAVAAPAKIQVRSLSIPQPVGLKPPSTAPSQEAVELANACSNLAELAEKFRAFEVPGLSASAQQFCFFDVQAGARVLVLGDRPRTEEEQQGGVFAGKTALLLENMMKAIGLSMPGQAWSETVSLANLVPWRPPGNRNPIDIEIALCVPFMLRAIELLQPQFILCLGALPGKFLADAGDSVAQQRGKWHAIKGVPTLATFHPFELLNYPERKKLAWRDLQMFQERIAKS